MNDRADDERDLRRIVQELYASGSSPAGVAPPVEADRHLLHPLVRKCRTLQRGEPVGGGSGSSRARRHVKM
ncbi:MAG: hypothetical protein PVI57_23395 [Gemmatimonadota bacterium]